MREKEQNQQFEVSSAKPRKTLPEERKQLRISDIFFSLRKRLLLIIVCTVLGLCIGVVLSLVSYMRGEMSKQYLITASIAVTSQDANGLFTAHSSNPNSSDVYLAEDMVDAVMYVIRSDRTLNAAVEKLDLIGISTRDIYDNLQLSQYKETQIIELNLFWRSAQEGISILTAINQVAPEILINTLKIGGVSVINAPNAKYLIGGNLNASMWVYMAVLGALLGMGLAILEQLIRPTLMDTADVETVFGLDLLGEIPEQKSYFQKKRSILYKTGEDLDDYAVLDNYAAIAYGLKERFNTMEHPCVYVTSATKSEGKTTVTAYLAVQFAELGMKVLLVDMDTRNPQIGGLFLNKVEYDHSLNALYCGDADTEEAITHLTGTLDILPTVLGRKAIPVDEAMCGLIQQLRTSYDVVLIDTAPVGQAADTMGLNNIVDAALFVARFDHVSIGSIRESLHRIDRSGVPIIGCIVNGSKTLRNEERYDRYGSNTYQPRRLRRNGKTELATQWEEWERKADDSVLQKARQEGQDETGGAALDDSPTGKRPETE